MLVGFQDCPGQLAPSRVLTSVLGDGLRAWLHYISIPRAPKGQEKTLGRILSDVIVAETKVQE